MEVVLFAPPEGCSACRATKVGFDKAGIEYRVVEAGEAIQEELRREGFTAFPVVKVDCGDGASWSWSGYRHEDIRRLADLVG